MSLKAGTMLGPYEILSQIGAGGMGEVYKARDTRLNRTVALKVLPAHLADRPELRERFKREAETIANLKHPNICVLYDIGVALASRRPEEPRLQPGPSEGVHYLVMEYLEGETLAQRLLKGPLPLDQVLKYAIEISDALDKAHRSGATHRDIKPGNIMLTKEGSKLLDFGLAKLKQEAARPNIPESQLPTGLPRGVEPWAVGPSALTADGTILGTLQYMAPEQVEGKVDEIDARTDIFAFGAVVHEMATGKKCFEGQSAASTIAKILEHDPPPVSSLQPMTPPLLDTVVKRCLAKDPDQRWQSANDLTFQMRLIAQGGSQASLPAPVVARRKARERVLAGIAAAAVLALVGILAVLMPRLRGTPSAGPSIRFSLPPPENADFTGGAAAPLPAVSPDGLRIAFLATSAGASAIWVQSFDSLTAGMLPGTEGASNTTVPFWSPDGRYIGFFADGKLKKVDVSGGPPVVLCDAPVSLLVGGGTWNQDGIIVFSSDGGLFQVSAAGGEAKPVTKVDESSGETAHGSPRFLPDGRHFLYTVRGGKPDVMGIYLGSFDAADSVRLLGSNATGEYSSGHVLFLRGRTLLAQPFDVDRPATDR